MPAPGNLGQPRRGDTLWSLKSRMTLSHPPPPRAPDLDATLAPPVVSGSNRAPARHGPERRFDKRRAPEGSGLRELFSPDGSTLAEVLSYGTTTAHAVRAVAAATRVGAASGR